MTDKKEEPYREGCDDTVPQEKEDDSKMESGMSSEENKVVDEPKTPRLPSSEKTLSGKGAPIPDTAFLVIRHLDGRIEAATSLPGLDTVRQADLRDIRDIAHALYEDVSTTIKGKVTAREAQAVFQKSMMQGQIAKMTQNMKKH